MSEEQKRQVIANIIAHLKFAAHRLDRAFDEGDTFFSLCFKTDAELLQIQRLAGC